jgi:DNA-binding CsgD family transcriptional regulator
MSKKIIIYALVLAGLAVCLKILEYRLVIFDHAVALYGGIVAVTFLVVGLYTGKKINPPKEIIVEKQVPVKDFTLNEKELEKLGLSKRELEILQLMGKGLSNQEIAAVAFLSINTVKTHVSNVLMKLNAKRRVEAVMKAKEMNLIG